MKKTLAALTLASVGALLVAAPALAHHGHGHHHGWWNGDRQSFSTFAHRDLGCGSGQKVVDVTYTVQNDLDTSVPIANVQYDWATDTYKRHVLVFQTGTNTFCAVTWSKGTFTTLAGHSPGGTSTIPAGITGKFFGGYVSNVFHGTLLATPLSPTSGDLGTKDFGCTASADHNDATKSCPSTFDWFAQYFASGSGADFQLAKYLFVYVSPDHGVWVDMERDGTIKTHGDIVASAPAKFAEHQTSNRDDEGNDHHGEHCHH